MTPEQGKVLLKVFTDTMRAENPVTEKVIRAVPEDKKTYRPDPKAKSAHELAWHIVTSHIWFIDTVLNGKVEWTGEPALLPSIDAIIEWFQTQLKDRLAKLESLPADHLVIKIAFMPGTESPLVTFLNIMNLHTAHHRGQLSTYLRPMGAKVPSIYGGSADEPFQP